VIDAVPGTVRRGAAQRFEAYDFRLVGGTDAGELAPCHFTGDACFFDTRHVIR
jgi:Zn-finger protein